MKIMLTSKSSSLVGTAKNKEEIIMQYFSNVQECPNCEERNYLFTIDPPRADLLYSYTCSSCKKKVEFKPAVGISVDSLPNNAVIITPV